MTGEPIRAQEWWILYEIRSVRLPLAAIRRLQAQADANGRSIADEAAARLIRSFTDDDVESAARRVLAEHEHTGD